MQIPQEDLDAVKKRLARAQGQLGGIIRMVEEGRECTDVLTQLAAAQAAISRAAFTLIAPTRLGCASMITTSAKARCRPRESLAQQGFSSANFQFFTV